MFLPTAASNHFDRLVSYAQDINERNQGSGTALVVIQGGQVVTEHYAGFHSHLPGARPIQADSQFNVASARKTYIGLAVALAVHDGLIASIDDPIAAYLPELDPALLAGTTVRHLLTHTHGLSRDQAGRVIREFAPGQGWAYENINIELVTTLVRRMTGQSVGELLRERVFAPLGLVETGWRTEPDEKLVQVIFSREEAPSPALGANTDGDGDQKNLFVSAREFAYWGYLHLKQGQIEGRQIVPAAVLKMAITKQSPPHADPDLPHNGFFWYVQDRPARRSELGERVPVGSYQILGNTGPLLLVIPEHDLVIARMYNKRYNYGDAEHDYLYYLRDFGNRVMDCLS